MTKVATADVEPCPKFFSALVFIPNTPSKLTQVQYEKHLDDLRPYLAGLKAPDFGIYLGAREPAFIPAANVIYAPSDLSGFLKKSRAPDAKYELGLLDHEIGHAVFEKNLGVDKVSFDKLNERLRQSLGKFNVLHEELTALQAIKPKISQQEYAFREKDIARRSVTVVLELKTLRKAELILTAYHELFADLTAAVPRSDPSINADGVRVFLAMERARTGNPDIDSPFLHRELNRELRIEELAQYWDQSPTVETMLGDPHGLFVPTKKMIWETLAPDLANPVRKGLILQKILLAVREQAQIVFRNGLAPEYIDNPQLNADLIDRIRKQFRR